MWKLQRDELESIAIGAGILGTGGGGNPYIGKLTAGRLLDLGKEIEIIPLADLRDDWHLVIVGGMGAPTITVEKLPSGTETLAAMRALKRHVGTRVDAVMPAEIGGGNSIEPMVVAALAGIPVVDADGMGRAFPKMPMITFFIYGLSCYPAAVCDEKGNVVVFAEGVNDHWLERLGRSTAVQMGGHAGAAVAFMSGADAKRTAIEGTLSWARRLGEAVRRSRDESADPLHAILEETDGIVLFAGKVVDVERATSEGWVQGVVTIEGSDDHRDQQMRIAFQNENLIAWLDGEVVATVPDLICIG